MSSSSSTYVAPSTAAALYALTLGLHKHQYASSVHLVSSGGTILILPSNYFSSYATMAVTATFAARETNIGSSASFYRSAFFKRENGTISQIGTTKSVVTDNDSGAISSYGASVSISVSGGNIVFAVNSGTGSMDWSLFCDVMIYGIA